MRAAIWGSAVQTQLEASIQGSREPNSSPHLAGLLPPQEEGFSSNFTVCSFDFPQPNEDAVEQIAGQERSLSVITRDSLPSSFGLPSASIRNKKAADPYLHLSSHKLNNQFLLTTLIIRLLFLNAGLSACPKWVVLIKPNCRYITSKYTPYTND